MDKIGQFTKTNIKILRDEIEEAVQVVAKKHGIVIAPGNCTFTINEVGLKLKLNTVSDSGVAVTREAEAWEVCKHKTRCEHLAVGDEIFIGGNAYTLSGFNTRARKQPVQFYDGKGRRYKCSIWTLDLENAQKKTIQTTRETRGLFVCDNGRFLCFGCLGITARTTGRDVSGKKIKKMGPGYKAGWLRHHGTLPECEACCRDWDALCGKQAPQTSDLGALQHEMNNTHDTHGALEAMDQLVDSMKGGVS